MIPRNIGNFRLDNSYVICDIFPKANLSTLINFELRPSILWHVVNCFHAPYNYTKLQSFLVMRCYFKYLHFLIKDFNHFLIKEIYIA